MDTIECPVCGCPSAEKQATYDPVTVFFICVLFVEDIAQKNTIIWDTESDIPLRLKNRIKATID